LRFSASILIGSVIAGRLPYTLVESARQKALVKSAGQGIGTTSRVEDYSAEPSKGKKKEL
jgi:hypothetical protein